MPRARLCSVVLRRRAESGAAGRGCRAGGGGHGGCWRRILGSGRRRVVNGGAEEQVCIRPLRPLPPPALSPHPTLPRRCLHMASPRLTRLPHCSRATSLLLAPPLPHRRSLRLLTLSSQDAEAAGPDFDTVAEPTVVGSTPVPFPHQLAFLSVVQRRQCDTGSTLPPEIIRLIFAFTETPIFRYAVFLLSCLLFQILWLCCLVVILTNPAVVSLAILWWLQRVPTPPAKCGSATKHRMLSRTFT